mgnify:CR=1 FL=1
MERKYCVYVHTNVINGKKYVGMTSQTPERRWGTNGRGYKQNLYFSSEIQEYGWDNFKHEIVADNMTFDEAYATIANGGVYVEPITFTKVELSDGSTLLENKPKTKND